MIISERKIIEQKVEFSREDKDALIHVANMLQRMENSQLQLGDCVPGFYDDDDCGTTYINPYDTEICSRISEFLMVLAKHDPD